MYRSENRGGTPVKFIKATRGKITLFPNMTSLEKITLFSKIRVFPKHDVTGENHTFFKNHVFSKSHFFQKYVFFPSMTSLEKITHFSKSRVLSKTRTFHKYMLFRTCFSGHCLSLRVTRCLWKTIKNILRGG